MLSDAQIKRVWDGMLSAEIRANYFAEAQRYATRQRYATWAALFLSSGALATFLIRDLPAEIRVYMQALLMLGTAALSLHSLVSQRERQSAGAADLHMRWNKLGREYERVWENVYADDAIERLNKLDDQAAELSKAGTAFPNEVKTMLKWEDRVIRHRLQPQN